MSYQKHEQAIGLEQAITEKLSTVISVSMGSQDKIYSMNKFPIALLVVLIEYHFQYQKKINGCNSSTLIINIRCPLSFISTWKVYQCLFNLAVQVRIIPQPLPTKSMNPTFYVSVITNNSRNYEIHHMMGAMGRLKDKKISCIPNNMEKYISFSLNNLRFIDSMQFLNAFLDT